MWITPEIKIDKHYNLFLCSGPHHKKGKVCSFPNLVLWLKRHLHQRLQSEACIFIPREQGSGAPELCVQWICSLGLYKGQEDQIGVLSTDSSL